MNDGYAIDEDRVENGDAMEQAGRSSATDRLSFHRLEHGVCRTAGTAEDREEQEKIRYRTKKGGIAAPIAFRNCCTS